MHLHDGIPIRIFFNRAIFQQIRGFSLNLVCQLGKVDARFGCQQVEWWHDDIRHKRADDFSKRRTDHHAHRHVDHIALECKFFEFRDHSHRKFPLCKYGDVIGDLSYTKQSVSRIQENSFAI